MNKVTYYMTTASQMNQSTSSAYSNIDDMVRQAHIAMKLEMDAHFKMKECIAEGWTLIEIDPWRIKSLKPIETWISENCVCPTHRSGNNLLFESANEATWFKLRWL